ncbi:MAG: 3,4-dihydroxy-2-butanone-4-phosphate synthase [Desulfurococcales archaeon]|nr:3,4-dihydroxy-2-butanone-4-phosphate synthase [Desulfurococcales archaeon]
MSDLTSLNRDKLRKILTEGKPVLIHDSGDRENEVDMVYFAGEVTPESVMVMRKYAGGLICYSMPREIGEVLGLKYMDELLRDAGYGELTSKVLGYGDPPNFSLWVNHKDVVTGIRDADRAKTIKELDNVVDLIISGKPDEGRRKFYQEFIAPGHVPVLLGRGLDRRRGHTELSLALMQLVGLRPSSVIVEMLSPKGALSVDEASEMAERIGTVLLKGDDIVREWKAMRAHC